MANPPRRASSSSESSESSSDVSSTSSGSRGSTTEALSPPKSAPPRPQEDAAPRPWRFLSTEETCHFFNTEVVINTNDVRKAELDGTPDEAACGGDGGLEALEWAPPSSADPQLEPTPAAYEDVFSDFDDMYLPEIMMGAPRKLRQQREAQCEDAAQVLRAFCTDLHVGQSYLYRKRSEFLRVCFRRALDAQKEQALHDSAEESTNLSEEATQMGQRTFRFQCSRLESPIDVTIPVLYPRKWPHIPFRDPSQWKGDPEAAIAFAKRVNELPEGSLLYEPIDVDDFASRWCAVMKVEGIDVWALESADTVKMTRAARAALAAMMSFAVCLQSFSLLQLVAEVCLQFGHSTHLVEDAQHDELARIFDANLYRLHGFVGARLPPATYPRGLISQWKMCSYQPSTSDAIATDGLFIYIYGRAGMLKVGTGRGPTVRDYVYAHNRDYCRSRDAERSWLCLIGDSLYCRSITMACNRVDRICKIDLKSIDELYFSPPSQTTEQPIGSSTVYAMVSDGVHLFVINSFDSQKHAPRKKSRPNKSRKTSASESKTSSDVVADKAQSDEQTSGVRVGDRVVRGPHWKWGSQDGEKGAPGTVERISTWGGVKGCGVTVRWDKSQRINTYRWGAEGCYDIVVVFETSDGRLEKKPLPNEHIGYTSKDELATPRHHFIVSMYTVSSLQGVVDLDQSARQSLLGVPSIPLAMKCKNADEHQLLTTVHEHTLGITTATTAWMCDGGTSGCLGDNSGVRFRCEQGCDFDLCEVCLTTTLAGKKTEQRTDQREQKPTRGNGKVCDEEVLTVRSSQCTSGEAPAIVEATAEDPATSQVDDLVEFWTGLFSWKECEFALQRAEQSFETAVEWLNECGEAMRRPMILPCVKSFSLEPPPNSPGLDPILLIAGSFYAVDGYLCIISPPGLFQSDRTKRALHATDTAWFFSLTNGSLSFPNCCPVQLKSVPAGSPVCVDTIRRRILVFSGYLNCVEEYAVATTSLEVGVDTGIRLVQHVGEQVYAFLHDADGQRWAHKAFKTAHLGLRDWISQIQSEATSVSTDRVVRENSTDCPSSAKALARRIRKLRLRVSELEKLGCGGGRGYLVPYCTDFRDLGLRGLLTSFHRSLKVAQLSSKESITHLRRVVAIWKGFLGDCNASDVTLHSPSDWSGIVDEVLGGLRDLASGRSFKWIRDDEILIMQSQVVEGCQDILLWGVDSGLFSNCDRFTLLVDALEKLQSAGSDQLPASYFPLMHEWTGVAHLKSEVDCIISFIRRALAMNTDASEGGFASLVCEHKQAEELTKLLFQLSVWEFKSSDTSTQGHTLEIASYTPVEKGLLALFNGCAMDMFADAGTAPTVSWTSPCEPGVDTSVHKPLFATFAASCLRTCQELVDVAKGQLSNKREITVALSRSICSKILPLVLSMMPNSRRETLVRLKDLTVEFATSLSSLTSDESLTRTPGFLPSYTIVESSHPYNKGQAAMRKVVRIRGATCLHIQFDPRCSTTGEADFVFVTPGHAWFHSDRIPFGENGIGDAGGCFFGSCHSGNWPRDGNGISVWGDTVTIMLCSTSQERERTGGEDDSKRWGLKCTVRGLQLGEESSWISDAVVAAELTLRNHAQRSLMRANHLLESPRVVQAEPLLKTVRIAQSSFSESRKRLAYEIIETHEANTNSRGGKIVKLYESALQSRASSRFMTVKSQQWKNSLRYALAIFVVEALTFDDEELSASSALFGAVLQRMLKLEQWMIRQAQLRKEWGCMVEESISVVEFTERFSGDTGRLRELCLLKRISIDSLDLKRAIEELYKVLASETHGHRPSVDMNDVVAQELMKKAEYVLSLPLQRVPEETAQCTMVSSDGRSESSLLEYLTSSSSITEVDIADEYLRRAYDYNLEGAMLLEDIRGISGSVAIDFVTIGGLGSCWSIPACNRLQLSLPRTAEKHTHSFQSAITKMIEIVGNPTFDYSVRLITMIDSLAAQARLGMSCSDVCLRQLMIAAAEIVLDHETQQKAISVIPAEIIWIAFRVGVESLIERGDDHGAFSILHEMVGRLLSINRQEMGSVSLFRVLKIVSAHGFQLQSNQNLAGMFAEVCLAYLFNPLSSHSPSVVTASLRALITLAKDSNRPQSSLLHNDPELSRKLLERIGALQSSIKVPSDESETKLKDCCVILLDSEHTRSRIVDLLDPAYCDGGGFVWLPTALSELDLSVDQSGIPVTNGDGQDCSEVAHWNVRCDGCSQSPLRGFRFKCFTCANYDLCSTCYANHSIHSVDHQFVRVASSSTTGELLQPRSKASGIVSEGSLIGSKPWIGSVLRSHLETYGFVVVFRGSSDVCLRRAKAISEAGFPSTVVERPDLDRLERFYDWESAIQAAFEPGSGRLARRHSSSSSSSTPRKPDRSVINQFNRTVEKTRQRDNQLPDPSVLLSEMVIFTRLLWSNGELQGPVLKEIILYVQGLGPEVAFSDSVDRASYYRALGLTIVLGGFVETFRIGTWVQMKDPVMNKQLVGIVKHYTGVSDDVAVIWCSRNGLQDSDTKPPDVRKSSTSHLAVVSEVELTNIYGRIAEETLFFPAIATVLKTAHKLLKSTPAQLVHDHSRIAAAELVVSWLRMYMHSMGKLPSLLHQSSPGNGTGNLALLLFQLAKASKSGSSIDTLFARRHELWCTQQAMLSDCQFRLATRPVINSNVGHDPSCAYGPGANGQSDLTEYVFNLYAHASRSELPQHSGRNKLLEYWEKNVIPAIEAYVAGSFKNYEMDYFFAQLREPLREGNPAAAMKIAFTLCDGHVPSGCHYPDPDTDWTALQIDDIEIGSQYIITKGIAESDHSDWPPEMKWTIGHPGVARVVCPNGCVLMQLRNPTTSCLEHWWYQVENLAVGSITMSISERSVDVLGGVLEDIVKLDQEMLGVIARRCVFSMLKNAPDRFPLVSGRQSAKIHFNIVDILRMAAGAELGVEVQSIVGENDRDLFRGSATGSWNCESGYELMDSLRAVLTKRFEYVPFTTDEQSAQAALTVASKSKVGKASKALSVTDQGSLMDSQVSNTPFRGLCEGLTVVKYRFTLMEALAQELKRSLDSSAAFLQQNAFMVASDVPPKPIIMLKVPGASSLVISFAIHPVLMDLPAGSSLEFFEDEQCAKRVFGFFGDKRGLNYLPPLVIPGGRCFVRASQAAYARYKFRVDPLTPDFGLALWIGDELYHRMISVSLSSFELESVVSSVLSSIADFLVSGVALLPPCIKGVVCQLLTKMVNFAISRSLSNSVPLSKLSVLARDLAVAVSHEQEAQKGLYSLPTQQLAELLATIEEVSRLRGSSTFTFSTAWWPNLVSLSRFTRVFTQKRDPEGSTDILARISCGRTPLEDIDEASKLLRLRDYLSERMILLQQLPRTTRVAELGVAVSRFIQHIALEECGEADDQTVLSAAVVYRRGITARLLHLPVDCNGETLGYAVVDVGRQDVIPQLLSRLEKEFFEFEGDPTTEDLSLSEKLSGLHANEQILAEDSSTDVETVTVNEDSVWSCTVCTLENPTAEVECAACGSPIPNDVANLIGRRIRAPSSRTLSAQSGHSENTSTTEERSGSIGWKCDACTLVNQWNDIQCAACGSERNPDLVVPSVTTADAEGSGSHDQPSTNTSSHRLSGLMFVELLRVASTESVDQVDTFLVECFTGNRGTLKEELQRLTQRESASAYSVVQRAGFEFATGLYETDGISAKICEIATRRPIQIYEWLRESGYDLNFESSHYTSKESARARQAKWTYQMDVQLISLARQVGAGVGVLSLLDLCPSFLSSSQLNDSSLLVGLESRDLRLRFLVLKSFNKMAFEALSLVNLRNNSDSNALRARMVAVRQILFPAVKIRFFADAQDKANLAQSNLIDANVKRPVVTLDRRRVAALRQLSEQVSLNDTKSSLFASTMEQLSTVKPSVLRAKRPTGASDPFVAFIVVFSGENVVGEGGPYRQVFNDIANELMSPGNDLFLPTQNSVMKIGEYRDRFLPIPSATSRSLLKMYEFVGVLMGCCIRTGVRLNVRLAPIVWKMLVKQSLSMIDLEHIDYSVCESLKFLESAACDPTTLPAASSIFFESFTTTLSDGTTIELKPGGNDIPVTSVNCKEYVRLVKTARFQECKPQVDAMLRGIGSIVPVYLLQLCTWSELQQWVCGSLAVDIDLLKRHTLYSSGMTPDKFPHLDMFWRVLSEFSEENKRRFINFAWGQDTLPADDAEFDRTHTRLLIKSPPVTDKSQDSLLPKADTCFFNIELPAYSSDEIMREKLLLAITLCTSMDGDEQAGRMDLYFASDDLDDDHIE